MSDHINDDCWSCAVRDAAIKFAQAACRRLLRKVIFRLQRIKATGIYGDDYCHKTLWDEYCHEVQYGPHLVVEDAMEMTVESICDSTIEAIPNQEAVLLTVGAVCDLDDDEDEPTSSRIAATPHLIRRNLRRKLAELAGARNLARFDPNRT